MGNATLGNFDVIVLLAGDIEKGHDGEWKTSPYDNFGASYATWRVLAVAAISKNYPDKKIIVSGGFSLYRKEACPSIAEVSARELIDYGIGENLILKEDKSHNTYSQLINVLALCKSLEFKNVIFVTSIWATNRVESLCSYILLDTGNELKDITIKFLAAETVLLDDDPDMWQSTIERVLQSEEIQMRIKMEQNGVFDIKNGRYKFT